MNVVFLPRNSHTICFVKMGKYPDCRFVFLLLLASILPDKESQSSVLCLHACPGALLCFSRCLSNTLSPAAHRPPHSWNGCNGCNDSDTLRHRPPHSLLSRCHRESSKHPSPSEPLQPLQPFHALGRDRYYVPSDEWHLLKNDSTRTEDEDGANGTSKARWLVEVRCMELVGVWGAEEDFLLESV